MAFPKPTSAAKKAFESMLPPDPRVRVKPMFGNLAAFVEDRMFLGVFGDTVFLRLSEADRTELTEAGTKTFEPMAGRPMKEYIVVPEAWCDAPEEARKWVGRSLDWTLSLPTKVAKPRSPKSK